MVTFPPVNNKVLIIVFEKIYFQITTYHSDTMSHQAYILYGKLEEIHVIVVNKIIIMSREKNHIYLR